MVSIMYYSISWSVSINDDTFAADAYSALQLHDSEINPASQHHTMMHLLQHPAGLSSTFSSCETILGDSTLLIGIGGMDVWDSDGWSNIEPVVYLGGKLR
jgi:hypothetical protein